MIRGTSALSRYPRLRKLRLALTDLRRMKWRIPAFFRFSLPDAVKLKRLAADLLVFILLRLAIFRLACGIHRYFFLGAITMDMFRPSILGGTSIMATSSADVAYFSNSRAPNS